MGIRTVTHDSAFDKERREFWVWLCKFACEQGHPQPQDYASRVIEGFDKQFGETAVDDKA